MFRELKTLLWKDFRLNIYCFVGGLAFIAMPCLLLFFHEIRFSAMWVFSTYLSPLTMALLGGNIIASEREDRSAMFLNYQGASRRMVLGSKLICCIFTLILSNAIIFAMSLCISWKSFNLEFHASPWQIMGAACIVGVYLFGYCLLISLFSRPLIAIVMGIISAYAIALCLCGICYLLRLKVSDDVGVIIVVTTLFFIGLLSLVVGTRHFLRSKES
jgi:ABC-type transport system involved in multi-copper enzyme maturation permease subunit